MPSKLPPGVRADIHLYFMPTDPESFSDGACITIGGCKMVPLEGEEGMQKEIEKRSKEISSIEGVGPVRMMTDAEIDAYKAAHESGHASDEGDEEFDL